MLDTPFPPWPSYAYAAVPVGDGALDTLILPTGQPFTAASDAPLAEALDAIPSPKILHGIGLAPC